MRNGLLSVIRAGIAVGVAAVAAVATLSGCGIRPSGPTAAADAARAQAPSATASPTSTLSAQSAAAVEATFTAAIEAVESFGSPPPAYQLSVQSAISMRKPVPGFSQTLRSDLLSAGQAAITRYFAQPQAAVEQRALAIAVAGDVTAQDASAQDYGQQSIGQQSIDLGSGASRVTFSAVRVIPAGALVEASVRAWSLSLTRQPDGQWQTLAPVRVLPCSAVVRPAAGGQWQVVSLMLP